MAIALDLGADSALSDYNDLVAKVKLWLDRDDLDTFIPTFIRLAEGHLNRELRTPEMEVSAPVASATGGFTLPLDAIAVRGLSAAGHPLTAMSPEQMAQTFGAQKGCTRAFAITGRQVATAPVSDDALTLVYWQRIPPLTQGQPSNWLFAAHPDVYLYGTLFQANTYVVDTDAAERWGALFDAAVQAVASVGTRARYGGPIVARSPVSAIGGVRA